MGGRLSVTILSSTRLAAPGEAAAPQPASVAARQPAAAPAPVEKAPAAEPAVVREEPAVFAVVPEIKADGREEMPMDMPMEMPVTLVPPVHTPAAAPEPRRERIAARAVKPEAAPAVLPAPPTKREERQATMQFEPVTRGRFEKSEPTIVDGQDLDVPTFLRRNIRVR